MKTAIVTDSNSGISQEEARRAGIYVLPMEIIWGIPITSKLRYSIFSRCSIVLNA